MSLKKGKKFWGESWWVVLHSAAAGYTLDKAPYYRLLISSYTGLIPCQQCRDHFKENLQKYPVEKYLRSNEDLLFWTYIVHDAVNQSHNVTKPQDRPKFSPPFEEIRRIYLNPSRGWEAEWWFVLHSAAAAYSPEHTEDYINLVKSYTGLMPEAERRLFVDQLAKTPLTRYLRNNQELFFWSYVMFDEVSKTRDKGFRATSYVDVRRYYFMGLGEECKACNM